MARGLRGPDKKVIDDYQLLSPRDCYRKSVYVFADVLAQIPIIDNWCKRVLVFEAHLDPILTKEYREWRKNLGVDNVNEFATALNIYRHLMRELYFAGYMGLPAITLEEEKIKKDGV